MERRQGAIVTRIHCLEHVQSFTATAFPNNNTLRTHTQTVDNKIANFNRAFAFDVGRAAFQRNDMFLLKLQFGCVFYCNDALIVRDET